MMNWQVVELEEVDADLRELLSKDGGNYPPGLPTRMQLNRVLGKLVAALAVDRDNLTPDEPR